MYAQVSAVASPTKNDMPQTVRRSAITYGAEFLVKMFLLIY